MAGEKMITVTCTVHTQQLMHKIIKGNLHRPWESILYILVSSCMNEKSLKIDSLCVVTIMCLQTMSLNQGFESNCYEQNI